MDTSNHVFTTQKKESQSHPAKIKQNLKKERMKFSKELISSSTKTFKLPPFANKD